MKKLIMGGIQAAENTFWRHLQVLPDVAERGLTAAGNTFSRSSMNAEWADGGCLVSGARTFLPRLAEAEGRNR